MYSKNLEAMRHALTSVPATRWDTETTGRGFALDKHPTAAGVIMRALSMGTAALTSFSAVVLSLAARMDGIVAVIAYHVPLERMVRARIHQEGWKFHAGHLEQEKSRGSNATGSFAPAIKRAAR